MTDEEKLRFEVGEGFNKLSDIQLEELYTMYRLPSVKTEGICHLDSYVVAAFLVIDPERLIQFIGNFNSRYCSIPIIGYIEDEDLRNYAYRYLSNVNLNEGKSFDISLSTCVPEWVLDSVMNIGAENLSDPLLYYCYHEIKRILKA